MEWSLQNDALARVGVSAPGRTRRAHMFGRLPSPVVARLLAQGTMTRPLGLLTVRGWNTGRFRTTPVAVSESGGTHRLAVLAEQRTPEAGAEVLKDAVAPDASSGLTAWFVRRYVDVKPDAALTEFVSASRQHLVFAPRESSHVISHGRSDSINDRRQQ